MCPDLKIPCTIEHLLVSCEALSEVRVKLLRYMCEQCEELPELASILESTFNGPVDQHVQFLLDPSVVPSVISGCQQGHFDLKQVLTMTMTYCYGLHRRRLQLSGRFNLIT